MIYRGKAIMSAKLAKQLKALERKSTCVSLSQTLDVVMDKLYAPKPRRPRG